MCRYMNGNELVKIIKIHRTSVNQVDKHNANNKTLQTQISSPSPVRNLLPFNEMTVKQRRWRPLSDMLPYDAHVDTDIHHVTA